MLTVECREAATPQLSAPAVRNQQRMPSNHCTRDARHSQHAVASDQNSLRISLPEIVDSCWNVPHSAVFWLSMFCETNRTEPSSSRKFALPVCRLSKPKPAPFLHSVFRIPRWIRHHHESSMPDKRPYQYLERWNAPSHPPAPKIVVLDEHY